MSGRIAFASFAAALSVWIAPAHAADPVADFYRGKTIAFIIGSGEGGAYDLGGRLMARYLARYIPGNPTLVPQNMPGASSLRAAAYIYSVAPHDGTAFGTAQPTIVLNKLLDPGASYQPEKYTWIGRLQPMTLVGVAWSAAAHHTMADAKKEKLVVSASGASGTSAIVPWALNRIAGTHFQVVTGYQSLVPQFLAMERGEVEGIGSATLGDVLKHQDWIANRKVELPLHDRNAAQRIAAAGPGHRRVCAERSRSRGVASAWQCLRHRFHHHGAAGYSGRTCRGFARRVCRHGQRSVLPG